MTKKVVNIDSKKHHILVYALCLRCLHQWKGLVLINDDWTQLECSVCKNQNSFTIPFPVYMQAIKPDDMELKHKDEA